MKLDAVRDSLEGTSISKMDVNVNSLTYSLMIDGIYTNKLGSVIREVSTNARDSLISCGKDKFTLTFFIDSETKDIKLSFKDEGMGLNEADTLEYLCNLNASSKRDSDNFVGCFGIGSKSPFSLTDSYSFTCVKDNIKTNLNLFRIDKETPRFDHTTEPTDEVDSVECIIPLGRSYTLQAILEEVYKELSLFDTRPDLRFVTQTLDVILPQEDFFPQVESFEDHYKVFSPEYTVDTIKLLNSAGVEDSYVLFRNCDQNFKDQKQVACGVIAYKYTGLSSRNSMWGRHSMYNKEKPNYFPILKFDLDSSLSFDVSRENISVTSETKDKIYEKLMKIYNRVGIKELTDFVSALKYLTPKYSHSTSPFDRTSGVYLASDNTLQKTSKLIEKIKTSFEHFKNVPDFLNLFLGLKEHYSLLNDPNSVNQHRNHPREDINRLFNLILPEYTANFIYLLERIVCQETTLYDNDKNKDVSPNISRIVPSDFKHLAYAYKNIFSGFDLQNIKKSFLISGEINNLDELKVHFIYTNSRLRSERDLEGLVSDYLRSKELNNLEDNVIVYVAITSKKIIEESGLISNLESVRMLGEAQTFSLKTYADLNPEFVVDLKPEPKPKKVPGEPTALKEFSENNIKLRNNISVTWSTFNTTYPRPPVTAAGHTMRQPLSVGVTTLVTQTEETTSVKLSNTIKKELPQFSEGNYRGYYGHRQSFVLLVSKDIIENQEQKDAIIVRNGYNFSRLYFEFENPDYQDIKDVFESTYKCSHEFTQGQSSSPEFIFLELNKDYFEPSLLEPFRQFLGMCFIKYKTCEDYFKTLEEFEIPKEASSLMEAFEINNYPYTRKPKFVSEASNKAMKLHKLLMTLGGGVVFDYLQEFKYYYVLYLMNIIGKVSVPLDYKFIFSQNHSSVFSNRACLENFGSFMFDNLDNLFYKVIDKEYLEGIEEEYKDSLTTINTEEITNLLKRF